MRTLNETIQQEVSFEISPGRGKNLVAVTFVIHSNLISLFLWYYFPKFKRWGSTLHNKIFLNVTSIYVGHMLRSYTLTFSLTYVNATRM